MEVDSMHCEKAPRFIHDPSSRPEGIRPHESSPETGQRLAGGHWLSLLTSNGVNFHGLEAIDELSERLTALERDLRGLENEFQLVFIANCEVSNSVDGKVFQ